MGHIPKLKYELGTLNVCILTNMAFRPTMAQMPNLVLIEKKRITVYVHGKGDSVVLQYQRQICIQMHWPCSCFLPCLRRFIEISPLTYRWAFWIWTQCLLAFPYTDVRQPVPSALFSACLFVNLPTFFIVICLPTLKVHKIENFLAPILIFGLFHS
jgi:hypothetical protein